MAASPSMTNYPNGFAYGINIRGMPVNNAYSGRVWWLDSVTGADGNPGTHIRPFATLQRAINQARANKGDIIMVRAGHAETISTATALALATAGVSIIGNGINGQRPTFTLDTATTATIGIQAANISFTNCLFVANFAAIASLFTLTNAPGFTLLNCEFRDTTSVLNFVAIVTTDTTSNHANDLAIQGCNFNGLGATANTTMISMLGTNARVTVQGNYMSSAATTDGGAMIIATGKVVTGLQMTDNYYNLKGSASSTGGILITTDGSTNSGVLTRNNAQSLDATTPILVTASSGFVFGLNYYTHTADKSGYLLPAADS